MDHTCGGMQNMVSSEKIKIIGTMSEEAEYSHNNVGAQLLKQVKIGMH